MKKRKKSEVDRQHVLFYYSGILPIELCRSKRLQHSKPASPDWRQIIVEVCCKPPRCTKAFVVYKRDKRCSTFGLTNARHFTRLERGNCGSVQYGVWSVRRGRGRPGRGARTKSLWHSASLYEYEDALQVHILPPIRGLVQLEIKVLVLLRFLDAIEESKPAQIVQGVAAAIHHAEERCAAICGL